MNENSLEKNLAGVEPSEDNIEQSKNEVPAGEGISIKFENQGAMQQVETVETKVAEIKRIIELNIQLTEDEGAKSEFQKLLARVDPLEREIYRLDLGVQSYSKFSDKGPSSKANRFFKEEARDKLSNINRELDEIMAGLKKE